MKAIALVSALLLTFASAAAQPGERVSDFLGSHEIPSVGFLTGEWHYDDNSFVFFKEPGGAPGKDVVDRDLEMMTVTPDNCVLTFVDKDNCTFRVGANRFKVNWKLDPQTREFSASVALFKIKGYLVQAGDRIALVYAKSDLEMMMRFLCPLSTHKYIRELSRLLGETPGLTLCIYFKK